MPATSFDPLSCITRKNPFGAVDAFKLAFKQSSNVFLVIRANVHEKEKCNALLKKLKEYCGNDKRIFLITEKLSYQEVLSLYASCDVFVSLHRAEGFGLVPLEAMRLGKPVIATAWSGNMDYMNNNNSCLVSYKFIPVKSNIYYYTKKFLGKTAFWADPSVKEASVWMKKLAENQGLRESIGKKAIVDSNIFQKKAEEGNFINEIISLWETRDWRKTEN